MAASRSLTIYVRFTICLAFARVLGFLTLTFVEKLYNNFDMKYFNVNVVDNKKYN